MALSADSTPLASAYCTMCILIHTTIGLYPSALFSYDDVFFLSSIMFLCNVGAHMAHCRVTSTMIMVLCFGNFRPFKPLLCQVVLLKRSTYAPLLCRKKQLCHFMLT